MAHVQTIRRAVSPSQQQRGPIKMRGRPARRDSRGQDSISSSAIYAPGPTRCADGKGERFNQTALPRVAYARSYGSSRARAGALGPFLTSHNTTRHHTAHDRKPPISRLSA